MVNSAVTTPAPRITRRPIDRAGARKRRARVIDTLIVTIWASAAIAISLFLVTADPAGWTSLGTAITNLGIVTGLVGSDLVLVMLILAARIPFLDRTIGHDRAIAVHRQLGKPALYLLLAHAALLTVGYAITESVNPFAELVSMMSLSDMPLAWWGLGLLIAVVVTSLVAVRRAFNYEWWHAIHLASYAAVAVAIPHQLSLGGVLADPSPQRTYWIALYAIAFGAIIWFRFLTPVIATLRHRMTVAAVTTLAPGVVSIDVRGRALRDLHARGGQFVVWRFWSRNTWWHAHPLSLSALPTDSTARITVRDLGRGSGQLASLRPGTRVSIEGPYGLFTERARTAPRLAIAAAGIGVTPVRALLEDAALAPGEATVLLRASTLDETYHWEEIRRLCALKGATLYTMVGPRATVRSRWLSDADERRGVTLLSVFPELLESDLFACGPGGWLDEITAEARAEGLPDHQLHAERFDW